MIYLKLWYRDRKWKRQAHHWLDGNGRETTVAYCLFHLNRCIKRNWVHEHRKHRIYKYKTLIMRHLYEQGYCQSISTQRQTKECWSCDDGIHWTGYECQKCAGTGIYATHILYRFVFNINGRRYIWHQPKNVMDKVGWEIEAQDNCEFEYAPPSHLAPMPKYFNEQHLELYTAVLHEYLCLVGIQPEEKGFTFWEAIGAQFGKVKLFYEWDVEDWLEKSRIYRSNLSRLMEFLKTGEMPEPDIEDDIPF